jgi:high-affinity K+ transport system ATPase subunit B
MGIVRRDGKVYSYGSVELVLDGEVIPYDCEIDYDTGEVEESYVTAGGRPVGRTRGQLGVAEVTIKMPRDAWDQFRAKLGAGYKKRQFDASVSFADDQQATQTDGIIGIRILNDKVSVAQGSEAIMQELTCKALKVLPGGLETF